MLLLLLLFNGGMTTFSDMAEGFFSVSYFLSLSSYYSQLAVGLPVKRHSLIQYRIGCQKLSLRILSHQFAKTITASRHWFQIRDAADIQPDKPLHP
jgi:hypothetical protein